MSTPLVSREFSSHWYLKGAPFYEIAKKDGSGMRSVTIRDARAAGAVPSVTNILDVIARPALTAWKVEQGIMAALTLPRAEGEALDAFAHRVVEDMGKQSAKAAEFGTAVHDACAEYAMTKAMPTDTAILQYVAGFTHWFDENVLKVHKVEAIVTNDEQGYAGRLDLLADLKGHGLSVVDFKTQGVKKDAKGAYKPAFYETWPLQLSAYAVPVKSAGLVSVVINSAEPGPVHVQAWTEQYYETFLDAFRLWKYVKGWPI
jgi:hypothetical protein